MNAFWQDLQDTDDQVCLIWKFMLKQLNEMSLDMAAAIAEVYPSPYQLLEVSERNGNGQWKAQIH